MPRLSPALLLLLALLPLGGCSESYSPDTYAAAAAQQAATVQRGVIVGVRPVLISANGTVGAVAGGAAGGVTGAQAPGGTIGAAFGAIGGTLVGGLAGTAAEQAVADAKGWEYIVQETDGHLVSVTQTDKVALPIGLHVLVIAGKQARVVQDYTVKVPETEKPAKPASNLATAPIYVTPLAPGQAGASAGTSFAGDGAGAVASSSTAGAIPHPATQPAVPTVAPSTAAPAAASDPAPSQPAAAAPSAATAQPAATAPSTATSAPAP